ncbi:hypothetical protein PISMIDRAFT_11062 [Pisolithus microcarpus 441]|uniref:Unplaced genomic scaffold scaffold_45, whole genome shotgun sequence n=1 Tax=Pisolithus microcarpus 441 TaxID=765257 RepID=A0A0C9Z283_9AGAM|nr:hypothetical protein PISMIDRAFT_11062 [Pisolithus microcarpus 441]
MARIKEVVSGDEEEEEVWVSQEEPKLQDANLEYTLAINEKDKLQHRQKFDGVIILSTPSKSQGMNPGPMMLKDASSRRSGSPGFCLGVPADVPGVKKKTFNTMLDMPIPIPMRDLLALKLIQKVVREYTLVKRVPTDGSAAGVLAAVKTEGKGEEEERAEDIQVVCIECEREEPEIQRLSMMPLTYVAIEVMEQVRLKGILDSGSQIIALQKEIAEVLRLPIEKDSSIMMETANQGREATEGVISDCLIDFSGVMVHVLVQVIKNAAFDILLR